MQYRKIACFTSYRDKADDKKSNYCLKGNPMCYKYPGPRCSSHAQKRLERLEEKNAETRSELRDTYSAYKEAVEEFRKDPENKTAANLARKLHREARALKEKSTDLSGKIHFAQRDFDGTHKGQKILKDSLASFDKENGEFSEYAALTNRMASGKMLYTWRKNQLQIQQDEAATGKTLKERRGKFFTLSDRSESDVIELDPDMIEAISNAREADYAHA
jgi:hypothetical protein